jgi:hypothetical protein
VAARRAFGTLPITLAVSCVMPVALSGCKGTQSAWC